MQCENAYTKPGVRGILCRKAEIPAEGDLKGIAHALCGHQRFCPNQRCYTMLPGWEECKKRHGERIATASAGPRNDNAPETREEDAESEIASKTDKLTGKKKSAKKGTKGT